MHDDRDRVEPESLDGSTGISLLRAIVALIAALPDGGGVPGQNFAAAVAAYENGAAAGIELGECFGLKPSAGPAWWTKEARRKRASLIIDLDQLMFPADRPRQHGRALKIAQRLQQYETAAWPRERSLPVPPAEPVRCAMWKLLKMGAAPGWRTVERRLAEAGAADLPNARGFPDKKKRIQSSNANGDETETAACSRDAGHPADR